MLTNVVEIRDAVLSGRCSAKDVLDQHVDRIRRSNDEINAFCEVFFAEAEAAAGQVDDLVRRQADLPLAGVPVGVKDCLETVEGHTTLGSRALVDEQPGFDAVIVARMRRAGALVIGKTTMPEFGISAMTDSELYGFTRNPYDLSRTPGGSSGGSAAAVAGRMAAVALGTDGGGSVRVPASCCGLVGLKPTRGRITFAPGSREPFAGFAAPGPMAHTVRDVAVCFDVIAGAAKGDPYVAPELEVSAVEACERTLPQLRVAISAEGHEAKVDRAVSAAVRDVGLALEELGHAVSEATPDCSLIREAFLIVSAAAFAAGFPRGREDLVEAFSLRLLELGDTISSAVYVAAVEGLRARGAAVLEFWREYDLLITPTVSEPPLPLVRAESGLERLQRAWDWDQYCWPFNVSGQPALTLPWGLSSEGLPLGVQLVADFGREDVLFSLASALETIRPSAG